MSSGVECTDFDKEVLAGLAYLCAESPRTDSERSRLADQTGRGASQHDGGGVERKRMTFGTLKRNDKGGSCEVTRAGNG